MILSINFDGDLIICVILNYTNYGCMIKKFNFIEYSLY